MLDIDSEIAAAVKRIERVIDRKIHFEARSAGQRRRREREHSYVMRVRANGMVTFEPDDGSWTPNFNYAP